MSKRTKKIPVMMPGSQEDENTDDSLDVEDQGMETAIKDFADGERYIKLYRHPNELTGGRPRLLCAMAREDFNDVNIQDKFGGGKYFGRWRKRNGQYTRFNFDIDGEPKVMTRAAEEAQRNEQARDEGGAYNFLDRNKQQQDEQGEQEPDRGIGTADILRIMAETRRESREEMRMLLELMRPAQQPQDATEKVFSLVEKIVPLISQGGGNGDGGNPWLFALAQLKEPLMKMVDTIHTAVTKPPTAPGVASAGPVQPGARRLDTPTPEPLLKATRQEPPTAEPPEPEPKSEDDMLVESFKPYLGMLMKAAEQGKDPGLYSDLILDQIPVFAYDRLRVWLNKAGCLSQLEAASSQTYTTDQRAWFESLRGLLLDSLNEELGHGVRTVQPSPNSDPSASGPADSPLIS